jgi:hypothetical protein
MIPQPTLEKYARSFLYFVLCPLILISYLLERFTGDVRIYLGTGMITDMMGGLDAAWEIKPPGNRLLFYVLSKFPGDSFQFQILTKAAVAVITICIIYYFAKQLSENTTISFDKIFLITFISIFAVSDYFLFETEWFATILVLLMIGLYLSKDPVLWFIAGFLCLPLLLLKGITVVLIGIVIASVCLFTKREGILSGLTFVEGGLLGIAALPLLQFLYFPHLLSDFILSSALSHASQMDLIQRCINWINFGMTTYWYAPVVAIGIAFLFAIYYYDCLQHPKRFLWLLFAWVCAGSIAFIQGEFFWYHFTPLIIPAILTIVYFMELDTGWKYTFYVTVALLVGMWIFYAAGWGFALAGFHNTYWDGRDSEASDLNLKYNLSGQPSLLYLDPGDAVWYFHAKSASRYTCPLPVQRDSLNWSMSSYLDYKENYADIVGYNGKYIVSSDKWFFQNMTQDKQRIRDKIDLDYVKVDNGTWEIYERR